MHSSDIVAFDSRLDIAKDRVADGVVFTIRSRLILAFEQ